MDFRGTRIGEFLTIDLAPPFSAQRYLEAMQAVQSAGVEVLIIDSLSHAWTGEGGLLDLQNAIAKRSGNSYSSWREVTPLHNQLVDTILQCDMHVIVALRTKTEYVIEDTAQGKKAPRKIGTAPVFRDGIEYELSTFFEIAQDHTVCVTKDRTGLFDGQFFQITPDTGKQMHVWLAGAGTPLPKSHQPLEIPKPELSLMARVDQALKAHCKDMSPSEKEAVAAEIRSITGGISNYLSITDESILQQILDRFHKETA